MRDGILARMLEAGSNSTRIGHAEEQPCDMLRGTMGTRLWGGFAPPEKSKKVVVGEGFESPRTHSPSFGIVLQQTLLHCVTQVTPIDARAPKRTKPNAGCQNLS